jgi:hypothetical protein
MMKYYKIFIIFFNRVKLIYKMIYQNKKLNHRLKIKIKLKNLIKI